MDFAGANPFTYWLLFLLHVLEMCIPMAETTKQRPKYLNLAEIRLPLGGFASILHRISGAGLFLLLLPLIYLLQLSLGTPEDFRNFKSVVEHPLAKLILSGLLWAFLHHFCMGIRILLLDAHVGIELESSRTSAKVVLGISLLLTAILGVRLW